MELQVQLIDPQDLINEDTLKAAEERIHRGSASSENVLTAASAHIPSARPLTQVWSLPTCVVLINVDDCRQNQPLDASALKINSFTANADVPNRHSLDFTCARTGRTRSSVPARACVRYADCTVTRGSLQTETLTRRTLKGFGSTEAQVMEHVCLSAPYLDGRS